MKRQARSAGRKRQTTRPRYRMLSVHYNDGAARDVPGEHRALIDAALARDIDKACALLAEHYETTTRSVLAHEALRG